MFPRARLQELTFNGINGQSGGPAFQSLTFDELLDYARGQRLEKGALEVVLRRFRDANERFLDIEDGVNPGTLGEAGWGAIFPKETDPLIFEALQPLLRWREEQAREKDERLFQVYAHRQRGFDRKETLTRFLERRGASDGPVKPRNMPYYLMLVGGPKDIPFEFQYQLDVRYAVGRLCFDTPDEYAAYAEKVLSIEKNDGKSDPLKRRKVTLFAPSEEGEAIEKWMVRDLVLPLAKEIRDLNGSDVEVETVLNEAATSERLLGLFGEDEATDLLFTACHGLVFDDQPSSRGDQGALLCHGHHGKQQLRRLAVGASDLGETCVGGPRISTHFACFSGGVPARDMLERNPDGSPRAYAAESFVAALPQRLLSIPGGNTLAVVAHVGRAWTYSFAGQNGARRTLPFEQYFRRLLAGEPVGHALEPFNVRHAALSAEWLGLLQKEHLEPWDPPPSEELVDTFCTWLDARSFVVLGDPAVRLQMVERGGQGG